ncbi:MAG: helix-turn-helix domain-containing protein [Mycobacterium leprae]
MHARRLLVQRVEAGWPQARVAEQLGVARQTVSKWWRRYQRRSTPGRCPGRTPATVERGVIAARRRHPVGRSRSRRCSAFPRRRSGGACADTDPAASPAQRRAAGVGRAAGSGSQVGRAPDRRPPCPTGPDSGWGAANHHVRPSAVPIEDLELDTHDIRRGALYRQCRAFVTSNRPMTR